MTSPILMEAGGGSNPYEALYFYLFILICLLILLYNNFVLIYHNVYNLSLYMCGCIYTYIYIRTINTHIFFFINT